MRNLLLILLFVLPTALFSASPSCLAGMEVSLVDDNGKLVKSGKFDRRGQLTLDGLEDAIYTIRLTNNGKTCELDRSTTGSFRGLPTGKRQHKPVSFKLSDQQGGDNLIIKRDAASGLPTGKRQHKPVTVTKELDKSSTKSTATDHNSSRSNKTSSVAELDEGDDNDCDDAEFSVTLSNGSG
ncbi:MAG: hypothetical protein RIF34_10550, partial [Candidatus Kapaibacterium sp.]